MLRTFGALLLVLQLCHSYAQSPAPWIESQSRVAEARLLTNLLHPESALGAVIASPSKSNPDYFYHWVRDAALTMDVLLTLWQRTRNEQYHELLREYVVFSHRNQHASALSGLGEPKFYVDGSPYQGNWGRPQNDGPALRAITLIRYAHWLLDNGHENYMRANLYEGGLLAHTVIEVDLRYILDNWRKSSFDLWEEVRGHHFYTRMVQRRALLDGADLAERVGDQGHAQRFRREACLIEAALNEHICPERNILRATLARDDSSMDKSSSLDVAVILGVLHGNRQDGFLGPSHPLVLQTALALSERFQQDYSINNNGQPGVAIGRYPEDFYFGGNPWFITTLALGELYAHAARELALQGNVSEAARLRRISDDQFLRVKQHVGNDGSMSEQFDRATGYMLAADHLTWSYSAFLTAAWSRD